MTLENGAEITVGQVISRADFERIFWNASKSDGCFSFVPVKDAQGTAIPNTVEQTVIIRTPESTKPGSTVDTPATENGNTSHDTTSQTGSGAGTATGSNAGTPSGTGTSHVSGAASGAHEGTGTAGSGSGSQNSGSDTNPDANTANGPSKDDANSGEGQRSQDGLQPPSQSTGAQDKDGQTTPQGQDGSANNGQTPAQNSGSSSDTGNPATGAQGTGESTQTGGTQTGGESDGNGDSSVTPTNPPASEPTSPSAHQSANAPAPILPDYAPNQSVQQAIHANDKPVGASIFNGTNPEHAPSFVKITAIQDKDGADVTGAMTLGKGGTAITTDQVISKEQFDNVFLDALKAPGGSFKFVPVLDSEGTAMPGASEQTVSIGIDYLHHFPSQPFIDESKVNEQFSHYKIYELSENDDTNGTLDGMLRINGNERTPLQVGDLIRPEDFDKMYWDYTSNNGGRFSLVGVDAQGSDIVNEKDENLVMSSYAATRDGQEPPETASTEENEGKDASTEGSGISGHSASLHPESFTESASAVHGATHLAVNGQSTLDNLLEHQVIHGIL